VLTRPFPDIEQKNRKEVLHADMFTTKSHHPWFAVQTRSRHESVVAAQLQGKGYEPFLPLCKSRRRWSDRVKQIELPLFPGYLFCRFDANNRLPILIIPGVVQIVGVGKKPVAIDEKEISDIQTAIQSGLPRQAWSFEQIGQRARVEYGPLSGLEGTLVNVKGQHRLILSITLLQRAVAVEIDQSWATPIFPSVHLNRVPGSIPSSAPGQ
jgi:transcription antitermination factor NusG